MPWMNSMWRKWFTGKDALESNPDSFMDKRADVLYIWMLILTSFFLVIYFLIDLLLGTPGEAMLMLAPVPLIAFSYFYLFKHGYKIAAKAIPILSMMVVVIVSGFLEGLQTGNMVFIIPLLIATRIMIPSREQFYINLISAIIIFSFLGLLVANWRFNIGHQIITKVELQTEWVFNFTGATLASVFEVGFLLVVSNKLQTELLTASRKLMEEEARQQKLVAQIALQAHEIEKNNISHELHENINQILAAAKLNLELYRSSHSSANPSLERSYAYIKASLQAVNKLSYTLAAPFWQVFDLADAISLLLEEYAEHTEVKAELSNQLNPEIILSDEIRLAGYRIVQEQLKNVYAHSKATRLLIELRSGKEGLYISVSDNGTGFEMEQSMQGMGFLKMQGRVKFYSGEMSMHSAPGKGCRLNVFLPMPDEPAAGNESNEPVVQPASVSAGNRA